MRDPTEELAIDRGQAAGMPLHGVLAGRAAPPVVFRRVVPIDECPNTRTSPFPRCRMAASR